MENKSGGDQKNEEQYCPESRKVSQDHSDTADQLEKDRPDKKEIGVRHPELGHVLCRSMKILNFPDPWLKKN